MINQKDQKFVDEVGVTKPVPKAKKKCFINRKGPGTESTQGRLPGAVWTKKKVDF